MLTLAKCVSFVSAILLTVSSGYPNESFRLGVWLCGEHQEEFVTGGCDGLWPSVVAEMNSGKQKTRGTAAIVNLHSCAVITVCHRPEEMNGQHLLA